MYVVCVVIKRRMCKWFFSIINTIAVYEREGEWLHIKSSSRKWGNDSWNFIYFFSVGQVVQIFPGILLGGRKYLTCSLDILHISVFTLPLKYRITIKQARSYRPHIHSQVNYYVNLHIAFFSSRNQIRRRHCIFMFIMLQHNAYIPSFQHHFSKQSILSKLRVHSL